MSLGLANHILRSHEMVEDNTLHVIGVISNHAQWHSRYRLFREWLAEMLATPNVKVHVVELAHGHHHHELAPDMAGQSYLPLRSAHGHLWLKEAMINAAVRYLLPADWKYMAWVDCDIHFRDQTWAKQAIAQLQNYEVIQPWATCVDIGAHGQALMNHESFAYILSQGLPMKSTWDKNYKYCHTGFAWAMRRSFWEGLAGQGLMSFNLVGCYDEETEVYTDRGFIPFKELTLDDKVLSLSPDRVAEWGPVTKLFAKEYEGEMYRIKSSSLDMLVTPNHNMVLCESDARSVNHGKLSFREIRDVTGERRIPKTQGWVGTETDPPIDGVSLADWAAFMGIWLSEGWTYLATDKNEYQSKHYRIGIAQAQDENREKIIELLKRAFPQISFHDSGKNLLGNHKALFEYLRPLGKQVDRYIPKEIKDLPREYLRIFLDWYILGDGTRDQLEDDVEDVRIYTSSKRMRDDLIEVILKCGGWASYREDFRQSTMADGRVITPTVPSYSIYLHRTKNLALKTSYISKVPFKGMVYCCETPHHTLLVRRNGKMAWCGNSADHHMAWGLINRAHDSVHGKMSNGFKQMVDAWAKLAYRKCNGHVGFVPTRIEHNFHGSKRKRFYRERWELFVSAAFDPFTDLAYDEMGLPYIVGKPGLDEEIRRYNRSRQEDQSTDD